MNQQYESGQLPAGWYPDLHNSNIERYWAGTSWSNRTRPLRAAMPGSHKAAAIAAGTAVCLVLWILIAPWDLSELDTAGNVIDNGGDGHATTIFTVLSVLIALGIGAVLASPRLGRIAAIAGFVTWALIFGWRAAVARVIGANLWPLSFVYIVIPAVFLAATVVLIIEGRVVKHRSRI